MAEPTASLSYATPKPAPPKPQPGWIVPAFVGIVTVMIIGVVVATALALALPERSRRIIPAALIPYARLAADVTLVGEDWELRQGAAAGAAVLQVLVYGVLFGHAFRRRLAKKFVICIAIVHCLSFGIWAYFYYR